MHNEPLPQNPSWTKGWAPREGEGRKVMVGEKGRGKRGGKGMVKEKGDKREGRGGEGEKWMRRGREESPIAPLAQGPACAKAGSGGDTDY